METLMSMKEVCKATSLSRASIYRKVDEGKFPKPIELDTPRKLNSKGQPTGRIAFVRSKIEKWIIDRIT